MSSILEIRMQGGREAECGICGELTNMKYSVPTYNGDIVSNDFPDDLYGKFGGMIPVCRECFHKHERGEIETFDHYYVPQTLMGVHLIDGGGI